MPTVHKIFICKTTFSVCQKNEKDVIYFMAEIKYYL